MKLKPILFSATAAIAASAIDLYADANARPQVETVGAPEAADLATSSRAFGDWGIDLSSLDTAVRPGDDFERYANGSWADRTEIAADETSAGIGTDLVNLTQQQLRQIITSADPRSQIGALYFSFMDEAAIERQGARPIEGRLGEVASIADHAAFTRFMGATKGKLGSSLFSANIYADMNNPSVNTLLIGQAGLLLPDRDFYLDPKFAEQKAAYREYLVRTLRLIDYREPEATADSILDFETEVAKVSWNAADARDISKANNPMTLSELQAYAPEVDWLALLSASGIRGQQNLIVTENTAVRDIAKLYAQTPLATLKAWQASRIATQASPYLSEVFVQSQFELSKALSGTDTIKPRWKRGVALVDGLLGELVGRAYVREHFPASSKEVMEEMVANLKSAMGRRIRSNSWMGEGTKQAALAKLAKMDVMVGYPDKWRDYSAVAVRPDDLIGNIERLSEFEWRYQLSKLGQPIDRKLWAMTPQTVNAYNGGLENKIVFPAAFLQPPMFDPQADPAVNYGAIGAVIGHEISHGFDDQGRKIDADGAVRDWWSAEDAKRFEALAEQLGEQFASYEAVKGSFINPKLTMGENIADLSGLQIAYDAYKASLNGESAPVLDGLTGDQRFFLAWAQGWQRKVRPETLKQMVAANPHSPARFRVIGPVRNLDPWYEAFKVAEDSTFYLPPEKRVRIW